MNIDLEHVVDLEINPDETMRDLDPEFVQESGKVRKTSCSGSNLSDVKSFGPTKVQNEDTVSIRAETGRVEHTSTRVSHELDSIISPVSPLNRFRALPYVPPEQLGLSSPSRGTYLSL